MPQQSRQSRSQQSRGSSAGGRTYQQLYADAKRQGIKGRSKMNKAQLEQALKH